MERINFHHLYYFSVVAEEGGLNKAAAKLRLSPSALSSQIKSIEDFLGHSLFERRAQRLYLSEAGKLALDYARSIFATGNELLEVMRMSSPGESKKVVRVGALAGLSKNLQFLFASPCLADARVSVVMTQGTLGTLLRLLENHLLDVVVSNMPVRADQRLHFFNHTMADVPCVVAGTQKWLRLRKQFPESLSGCPLFVPTHESKLREDLALYFQEKGLHVTIKAEVEDIALLRIFALSGEGVAILPEIAIQRDLKEKRLFAIKTIPSLRETFYAITVTRKFDNPFVKTMVDEFRARYPEKR